MNPKTGFSIMELMTVIAIIAITSAFTVPNIIAWRNKALLSEGTREILAAFRAGKIRAVKESRLVRVTITPGPGGGYKTTVDGDGDGIPDEDTIVAQGQIPGNIDLYDVTFSGDKYVEFDAKGLPGNTWGHAYLTNGKYYQGIIVTITGNVKTKHGSEAL